MKYKYKKFLKAAYIDYEEDYCSNAVLRSSRPPLSEILAPATFEITLSPGEGYYWTTFYTSMANYLAPEGVTVYKEHLEGRSITHSTVDDRIINKRQGVVIRSSTNTITLTKTYSRSSDDYSDNSLIGTDYLITNPGHAYALGYKDSDGVAFYRLSSTGKIKANKAYLIIEDIYLTQWRLVGNSQVHTDEYLTQWKVSGNSQIQQYLTQWKVEGNSVVNNNVILSCGDLGQDGKYHVKISNGVTIYDIPLTEPLRKVNDVADTIEFSNSTAVVTRNIGSRIMGDYNCYKTLIPSVQKYRYTSNVVYNSIKTPADNNTVANVLCPIYNTRSANSVYGGSQNGISIEANNDGSMYMYDENYAGENDFEAFKAHIKDVEVIYELATPTTEVIQAPQISVSPTNTYSSANTTPYSAFTYANPLIYSCGDYSDVDGKYHVKISNGVTIYDIPLTEPLRKVNNVADSIEFSNGVATVTRLLKSVLIGNTTVVWSSTNTPNVYRWALNVGVKVLTANILNTKYSLNNRTYYCEEGINAASGGNIQIFDSAYTSADARQAFIAANADVEIIYELATPTTETIQVSPFPISPTDTYTSANDTPYSAFEYKKNVEIWSCGEYSAVDGKYHIIVQPLGGSIVDIALDEPLRKVNDVADTIEFVDAVATVTRYIYYVADMSTLGFARYGGTSQQGKNLYRATLPINNADINDNDFLCTRYSYSPNTYHCEESAYLKFDGQTKLIIYDNVYNGEDNANALRLSLQGAELIYELATPTTKTIEVPQIQEADSYSCVISQGAKAVSWSDFETE